MKRKLGNLLYIIIILFLCAAPFIFIGTAGMQESTENTEKQAFPQWKEQGRWNRKFLSEAGGWFEKNFAFRQQLVSANAKLYADLFQVSSTKKVSVGTDGWLYYSATENDYKGLEQLSDRGLFNLGRILSMMQQRAEEKGSRFVFTVPPNKNTLYDANMPYYKKKVSGHTNIKRLPEVMKEHKVNYVDLYELFKAQDEVLYLRRDSHWNNKGAVLVYNELMNNASWPHNQYSEVTPDVRKDCVGDLASMLYPETAEPEENQYYPQIFPFEYVNEAQNVEASEIETLGMYGTGSLLMYRDSFGNSLLPFLAGEFGKAFFSKLVPYYYDEELESHKPDVVIVEKVERHLQNLAAEPPVMEGPERTIPDQIGTEETASTFHQQKTESGYYTVIGLVDKEQLSADARIFIKITGKKGKPKMYEAFPVCLELNDRSSDYGYQLYLKENSVPDGEIKAEVIVEEDGGYTSVVSHTDTWKK